jgi:hypothetical protein
MQQPVTKRGKKPQAKKPISVDIRKFFTTVQFAPRSQAIVSSMPVAHDIAVVRQAQVQDIFFESQLASHCGVHAVNHILGRALFTYEQAMITARFAAASEHTRLDEHATAIGNYSTSVLELMLASRDYYMDRVGEHLPLANDYFTATDRPDLIVLGVLVHAHSHYTAYLQRADKIFFLDSLSDRPLEVTYEQFHNTMTTVGVTVFQISVHVNHEPIFYATFARLDAMINAPEVAWTDELRAYQRFRNTQHFGIGVR